MSTPDKPILDEPGLGTDQQHSPLEQGAESMHVDRASPEQISEEQTWQIDDSAVHDKGIHDKSSPNLVESSPITSTQIKESTESEDWIPRPEANQENFDRRVNQRKKPPKTSSLIQLQRFLNTVVYKIYGSRIYQLVYAILTIAAIGSIWFSASQRAYLVDEAYANLITQGKLETEILRINQEWSADRIQAIKQGIATADRRRIFADYQGLANWLRDKNTYANQLNLNFSYTLGEGEIAKIDNTLEVPISVTLTPVGEPTGQSYFQMMDFTRHMVSTLWYVDVQEAAIDSTGSGATKMTAKISVWVHGKVKSDG